MHNTNKQTDSATPPIAISMREITKCYGDFRAVDHLSFDIFRNEIFGLLGPNGAGKTTTISMICGLLEPSSGSITFPGTKGVDFKSIIGYCPQENIFYPKLTCLEQLMFIGQMYDIPSSSLRKRAMEQLSLLGLTDKTNVRASKLSGGMKRRLNIALALIHDPEILILDEPEAGLDPQSRLLVREFIRTTGKEKTVILTTHNMDEADKLADRIAIVDHGKLLLLDNPQNLKRTIGDGDVLELVFSPNKPDYKETFASKLREMGINVTIGVDSALIKHPSIIENLSAIKELAEKECLTIAEIKLRENSLEDVFIHLTGRNLRQ